MGNYSSFIGHFTPVNCLIMHGVRHTKLEHFLIKKGRTFRVKRISHRQVIIRRHATYAMKPNFNTFRDLLYLN